jgi:hypothetical protein
MGIGMIGALIVKMEALTPSTGTSVQTKKNIANVERKSETPTHEKVNE